jgi:hypothetical protein
MDSTSELEVARDEVLRKIGRNILNLQRMEAMLKALVAWSGLNGAPSEMLAQKRKLDKSIEKTPMGRLVDQLFSNVYTDEPIDQPPEEPTDQQPEVPSEGWMSINFKVEADKEFINNFKKTISNVVAERNKLIHQLLATFDYNSIDSCRKLNAILDDQNLRIKPKYENLQSLVRALNESKAELVDYLDTEISKNE